MKLKKLLAVILAASLMTGCARYIDSDGNLITSSSSFSWERSLTSSEYSSEESSSDESSLEESSSSSSETISSSEINSGSMHVIESSSSKVENKKVNVRIHPETEGKDNWYIGYKLTYENGEYAPSSVYDIIKVYASDDPQTLGTLVNEQKVNHDAWRAIEFWVKVPVSDDTTYCRIQLVGDNAESEYSNALTIEGNNKSKDIPRYTHTFIVEPQFQIIPDYTKALRDIENGKEPEDFPVRIVFTCPGCGRRQEYPCAHNPKYSEDSKYINAVRGHCGMSNCPCGKETYLSNLETRAIKIS